MGGVEGVRYVPLNLAGGGTPPDALTRLLLTGAVLRGRIVSDGALLSLVAGNQKLPLPKSVPLGAGTFVEARITHENGAPHLRLQVLDPAPQAVNTRPQSAPPPASAPTPSINVPPGLAALIKPEVAAALLPKVASLPPKAMETLFTVLAARPELGRVLARLLPMVQAHAAEGPAPPEQTAVLRSAVQAMDAETPDEFRRAIEVARELIGVRGERAIVRAQGESAAPRTLLDDFATIRDHVNARTTTADGRELVRAMDTLADRISANTLQNIRSFDAPYQFFAIPFSPRTGIEHAQVHVLGRDGRGGGGGSGREAHLVVIDLHMTNLGSMWIAIQSTGMACTCSIRTSSDVARAAIDEGAPLLEESLRRAGFAAAQVRTEPWDGDRVGAAAALFAQAASFEAEA